MNLVAPQLADKADDRELDSYIDSLLWSASQKCDGIRLVVHVDGGAVFPATRNGQRANVPDALVDAFAPFAATGGRWVFDGEWVRTGHKAGEYWLFDLIEAPGAVSPTGTLFDYTDADGEPAVGWHPATSYDERRLILEGLFERADLPAFVKLLPRVTTPADKAALVARVKANGGEGVVFNRLTAGYDLGRRTAHVIKFKNRHDIDCVVTEAFIDGKANLGLSLFDGDRLVKVSECGQTGQGQQAALLLGAAVITEALSGWRLAAPRPVVKVLLQGVSADGKLIMPTYPQLRNDKAPTDCTVDQLDDRRINKAVLV